MQIKLLNTFYIKNYINFILKYLIRIEYYSGEGLLIANMVQCLKNKFYVI